jgi:glutamate dehydrogenase
MSANIKDRQADRIAALRTAKDNLLRRAAEASRSGVSPNETSGEALAAFLRRYYRHVVAEDLVDRRAEDVLAAALSHRSLAGSRPHGTATVRVTSPEGESHSLVEVVSDDMPFLVDSVTAELSRHDRAIHLVIHPQLVVRRDIAGRLLAVCDASSPESAGPDCQDAVVESWMHVEIDRVGDEEQLARLNADLERVMPGNVDKMSRIVSKFC